MTNGTLDAIFGELADDFNFLMEGEKPRLHYKKIGVLVMLANSWRQVDSQGHAYSLKATGNSWTKHWISEVGQYVFWDVLAMQSYKPWNRFDLDW